MNVANVSIAVKVNRVKRRGVARWSLSADASNGAARAAAAASGQVEGATPAAALAAALEAVRLALEPLAVQR